MDVAAQVALGLELADIADAITIARFRADDLRVTTKPDLTPVSEADEAVEQAIRAHLATHTDHAVLGEEYGETAGTNTPGADAEYRWIIDPIDGTKNYVRGVPIWATCIGLEHRGVLTTGVVSAPALHTRWWAGRGAGAFRDGAPIRASSVARVEDAQLSFAWDSDDAFDTDGLGSRVLDLAHRCWRTRGIGDFWQHVLVAEGAFDIAVDPVVSLWDVAALVPILDEAGARWSTVDGRDDADGGSFVCTNGVLHDEVLRMLGRNDNAAG